MNQYSKLTLEEIETLLLEDPDNKELLAMLEFHKDFIKKLKGVFERNHQKYYRR